MKANATQALLPMDESIEVKDDILSGDMQLIIGQIRFHQISNALLKGFDLRDIASSALNTPMRLKCELSYATVPITIVNNDISDMNRNRTANPDQHALFQDRLNRRLAKVLQKTVANRASFLFLNMSAYSNGDQYTATWNMYKDKSLWGMYSSMCISMTVHKKDFQTPSGLTGLHESNLRVIVRELLANNRLGHPLNEGFQAAFEHDPELCQRIAKEEALVHCNRWR